MLTGSQKKKYVCVTYDMHNYFLTFVGPFSIFISPYRMYISAYYLFVIVTKISLLT